MSNVDPALWTQRTVGQRSNRPNWTNPDCVPLTTISHVTHIANALEVVRTGNISAGLVYDESTLNTTRTTVVWVSPNNWDNAGGSRYGNIEFVFDWIDIQRGLNAYRIEVQEYRPPAYRILLTEKNYDGTYDRYYPDKSPGPWRLDASDNTHHWNCEVCLEVMVEASITLDRCIRTEFCKHHANRCCITPNRCPDRGFDAQRGGSLFVAGVIARDLSVANLKLTELRAGAVCGTSYLRTAWRGIVDAISHDGINHMGLLDATAPEAPAMARAIMAAISARVDSDCDRLCGMFRDRAQVVEACARLTKSKFGIPASQSLNR
jgi:hypothetical protein